MKSFDLFSVDRWGGGGDLCILRVDSRSLLHVEWWNETDTDKTRARIAGALWMRRAD